MSPADLAPRPVTLVRAVCAFLVVMVILTAGVAVAWLARETERSAADLMIARRLIGF